MLEVWCFCMSEVHNMDRRKLVEKNFSYSLNYNWSFRYSLVLTKKNYSNMMVCQEFEVGETM